MRVIVLPGLDGTGTMLTEFAAQLSKRFPTTVIAYPGDRMLSYLELADFVSAALPKGEPFALIAESFSGPVGTLVAKRRPTGLAGFAFVASFISRPIRAPRAMAGIAGLLPVKSNRLLRLARPMTFGRWADEDASVALIQAIAPVAHRVLAGRIREILHADYRSDFAGLDIPLFYLRPTGDRLVRASAVLEMARANPALDVRVIDGPHFILQTRAVESADILAGFVAGLGPQ